MIHFGKRIPIAIYPTFWLFAALIGFLISQSLIGILVWVGIIFVSVLFHEYGHALTALSFGQKPRIELVALGGLTYHDGQKLTFWKQLLIVFNGPLAGFSLYFLMAMALKLPQFSQGTVGVIIQLIRDVNLFWTLINLVPVMPLDGGQLLRIILEKIFGLKGFRYSIASSIAIALLISLFFFLKREFFVGSLFFLFAFQGYDTYRRTRHLSEVDRDNALRESLEKAEELIQMGKKEEALSLCETIRGKAKKGMIFELATQYLAFLTYEQGNSKGAYQLLHGIRSELGGDALCLLHKAAFDERDFPLVIELSGPCFQTWPTAETALRNAFAHAQLQQAVPTVGWMKTAIEEGLANASEILSDHLFDPIRQDPSFQELERGIESAGRDPE